MFQLYGLGFICGNVFKPGIISVLLLHLMVVFPFSGYAMNNNDWTLKDLKELIFLRKEYAQHREDEIINTKYLLDNAVRPQEKFRLQSSVFKLYLDYQLDSALVYAERMLQLSEKALYAQPRYKVEALLLTARVYAFTGMYKECEEILDNQLFLVSELPDEVKELYFTVQLDLNKRLIEHTIIERELQGFQTNVQANLDSLMVYTPKNSIWYPIYLSNKLRNEGDYDGALEVLLEVYNSLTVDDRLMAHVAYFIARVYSIKGDIEQQKKFLIISSITDVKHAVKEYASLWNLARVLYEEGDIETAHRFIEMSLQDAMYSGAYRSIQQIVQVLPDIYEAYNTKIIQQRDKITLGAFLIAGLLSGMVILVFFVLWQNKRLYKAKKMLNQTNNELLESNRKLNVIGTELHLRNAELQLANSQLLFLNKELVEMNMIKETYLSRFIDLCSEYIDKLDVYRMNLKRLMTSNKQEMVLKELQSTGYIEDESRLFLANFDETFLKIYPGFVDEFNRLFPEEEKQTLKSNELLNTELRIFALIRLGISDSNKIAKFLRCSITTVYTYRSKVKNKSLFPNEFEDRIMECSREEILL